MLIFKREQPLMFVFTQKGFIPGVQIMDGLQSAAVYELILMRVRGPTININFEKVMLQ